MKWRAIETYLPGVHPAQVLIAEGRAVGEARWHEDEGQWWWAGNDPTDAHGSNVYPTHWQRLPDPPSPSPQGVNDASR